MRSVIAVKKKDVLGAVRAFLARLLEAEVVDVLLVPMETSAGTVTPELVADPALLEMANPLAPVMGINAARIVGWLSARDPQGRIGVVLRPCELRALVELVKLKQARLDDVVTIGVDCLGTYDVAVYGAMQANGGVDMAALLATARTGKPEPQEGYAFRDACQMCEKPQVEAADVVLELFGVAVNAGVPVVLADEIAEKLSLSPVASGTGEDRKRARRANVIKKVVAERTGVRDARFDEMHRRLEQEGVEGVLAACVCCHNCMNVCPLCYCKTCLLESAVYDHEPMQYMERARSKGAYRLPADTMLFHLTRLNHMALSCVGCGLCTSACPADLNVGLVFRTAGRKVQETFDYEPGRSIEEPLPLTTFHESEWTEVGEE
jgi:formate dehydrogenase subunit beta